VYVPGIGLRVVPLVGELLMFLSSCLRPGRLVLHW
jgi:hypothetical protein